MELFRHGAFSVTAKGLRVDQGTHPDVTAWAETLARITRLRSGVQWAVGDLLLYADQRQYDEGLVETAMEATGFKRGTILNLKSVAKAFPRGQRLLSLSWSHHALVAGFEDEERVAILRDAARQGLSWEELQAHTRDLRHARRVAEMEWPTGTYGLLLADPPWPFEEGATTPNRSLANQYPSMSVDAICAMAPRVQAITAPSAVLYLWATSAMMVSGEAVDVVRAWGFNGRSTMVWVKTQQGMGYWARQRHEHLIIATRGNPVPPEDNLRPDSVLTAARGTHSEKPTELYEVIERCYPGVPRVELFARDEPRENWDRWGNAADMVDGEAARGIRIKEGSQASEAVGA